MLTTFITTYGYSTRPGLGILNKEQPCRIVNGGREEGASSSRQARPASGTTLDRRLFDDAS